MTFAEKYLYPPSALYPIAGALAAYFFVKGEGKPYAMIGGAAVGMLLNVGTAIAQNVQAGGGSAMLPAPSLLAAAVGKRDATA